MKESFYPRNKGEPIAAPDVSINKSLLHILITILLFYAAGKLTLPLSLPPSFATAIWPPAGIALAATLLWGYRVLPGIFLAELLIHNEVYDVSVLFESPSELLVFFFNPTNSVARAWLGCVLVKKFAAYPNELVSARKIAQFFLLAGPIATFFPAILSIFGLYFNDVIIKEDLVFAFLTWWLGDCTGIAVFVPLFFIIFDRSSRIWRQRTLSLGLPLILMFLITALVYLLAQQHEIKRLQTVIDQNGNQFRETLEIQFQRQLAILSVYEKLTESIGITEDNFRKVSLSIIKELSNTAGLVWLEAVNDNNNRYFIKRYSVTGKNEKFANFNSVLDQANGLDFNSGEAIVINKQDYLILLPVFETLEPNRQRLTGVIAVIFDLNRFVMDTLDNKSLKNIVVTLFNNQHSNSARQAVFQSFHGQQFSNPLHLLNKQIIALGTTQWLLEVSPDNKFLGENYSWSVWQLLAGGMFLTSFMSICLLLLTGHTETVRSEVDKRSEELKLSNSKLIASEQHFRKLVQTQSAIVWRIDPVTMRFLFVNDEAVSILGYPVKQWLDDPDFCQKHIHPDDIERAKEFCTTNTIKLINPEVEFRMYAADGRRVWLRNFIDLSAENGHIIEFYGFMIDITKQKQAEEQLRLAATTFESQQGILITDKDANILRVNKAFTEITGFSQEQIAGKNPSIFKSGRHDSEFYREFWNQLKIHGRFEGEIWNRRINGEIYPQWQTITAVKDNSGEVSHYVSVFSDITEKKNAENKIHALAFYDPLTGLPNRRLLLDRFDLELTKAKRNKKYGAVLFLDLDNFKLLNDTQGHLAGDELLIQVANRLSSLLRKDDTPARFGGDEFVVLLHADSEILSIAADHTMTVAEKIREKLNEPFLLHHYQYQLSPSIGIALFPDDNESSAKILQQADIAMYRSKTNGRNTISFFHPSMQQAVNHRVSLELNIRSSLEQGRFHLYYQPQIRDNGEAFGAEALIRWNHPDKGLLAPGDFIPVAEESGIILDIGTWVLREACRQIKSWQDAGIPSAHISININARQFRQKNFISQMHEAVDSAGIPAHSLGIELTENLIVADMEDTIAKIKALKDMGITIAIDDFGTGYSSLMYLKQLPIDVLKIDQYFVKDILTNPNDTVIIDTILSMARHLNLLVIAEGVETSSQLDFLKERGCPAFQGYYFSEPILPGQYAERCFKWHISQQ